MIDEKTLTLYYYNDGLSKAERQAVAEALQSDHLLAARFEALKTLLDGLRKAPVTTAPEHLQHQWHGLIERQAQLERQRFEPGQEAAAGMGWLGRGAVFASILALGIAIGVWLQQTEPGPVSTPVADAEPSPTPVPGAEPTAGMQLAAFERGLSLYLAESRGDLGELDQRSSEERAALLAQIISQNRLFEQAAVKQEVPEIARLMRAIEPLLLQLATTDQSEQDIERLRRQLGFELNAMLTKLQQPASEKTTTT